MPLPFIAAAAAAIALRVAVRAGVRVAGNAAARRAAAAAARRVANRSIQRGRDKLQREITRRRNCRTCKQLDELVNPCQVLSRGTGVNGSPYAGGSHAGNTSRSRSGVESHHMPASDAYPAGVRTGVMPAIQMDVDDHRLTASHGNMGNAGRDYRAAQGRLIRRGKLREAFLMDVLDVRAKFGDKYDAAIAEAAAYMECVNQYKDKYGFPQPRTGRRGRRRR